MSNRRDFLRKGGIAATTAAFSLPHLANAKKTEQNLWRDLPDSPGKEFTWEWVRDAYTVSSTVANLNNGSVSPQPKVVQEVFEHYNRQFNEIPSMHMWSKGDLTNSVKEKLAVIAGCSPDEIAINRNTTEAINTVIWGLDHERGDEVILCEQDYPTVMTTWEEKQARFGIILKWISFDLPIEDESQIVKKYTEAITKKTRAVMITHVNNLNGNILPVKAITAAVKKINPDIKVIVDGAHSFAHINFSISELGCDFYGTSLHKWLCAPFGTGLLYVKKKEIKTLWPLFTHQDPQGDTINKFSTFGTYMLPAELAIARAIDFHDAIGIEQKEERLRFLKDYWIKRVADTQNVEIKTSLKPEFACALGSFSLKNMEESEVIRRLYRDNHVHVTYKTDKNSKFKGIRVTPHVYTQTKELDKLVKGIKELASL